MAMGGRYFSFFVAAVMATMPLASFPVAGHDALWKYVDAAPAVDDGGTDGSQGEGTASAGLPYTVEFSDEEQRAAWTFCGWGENYSADDGACCYGELDSLFSPSIHLEAGKTYRLGYTFKAPVNPEPMIPWATYKVACGIGGTAGFDGWQVLVDAGDGVHTEDDFVDEEVDFTVQQTGSYRIGFVPGEHSSLGLRRVSLTEVFAYDAKLVVVASLPTMLPRTLVAGQQAVVAVVNRGVEAISGTVKVTGGDVQIGRCAFVVFLRPAVWLACSCHGSRGCGRPYSIFCFRGCGSPVQWRGLAYSL